MKGGTGPVQAVLGTQRGSPAPGAACARRTMPRVSGSRRAAALTLSTSRRGCVGPWPPALSGGTFPLSRRSAVLRRTGQPAWARSLRPCGPRPCRAPLATASALFLRTHDGVLKGPGQLSRRSWVRPAGFRGHAVGTSSGQACSGHPPGRGRQTLPLERCPVPSSPSREIKHQRSGTFHEGNVANVGSLFAGVSPSGGGGAGDPCRDPLGPGGCRRVAF